MQKEKGSSGNDWKKFLKKYVFIALMFLVSFSLLSYFLQSEEPEQISTTEFFQKLEEGQYSDIEIRETGRTNGLQLTIKEDKKAKDTNITIFNTEENNQRLETLADKAGTTLTFVEMNSGFLSTLLSVISLLITVGMFLVLVRFVKNQMNPVGIGKTDLAPVKSTVSFADVAGKVEEKAELQDVIDYFKNPDIYKKRGLKIPTGILLEGPSGTGKSLLAKALSSEINASFYSVSGSEFNGIYRGQGTAKIKELFSEAEKNAPSVIFIDEIDALARKRGGNRQDSDSDSTTNQLLISMDGFSSKKGNVVVLGATNLADSLDPAVMRSGRFDRKIYVGLPNIEERLSILNLYLSRVQYSQHLNVKNWVEQTQGFSGADLELFVNEANAISYKNGHDEITEDDMDKAFNKVIAGVEKKSTVYTPEQKEIIANHESGHALVGALQENSKRVKKVTIIPHGRAGGFAMMIPRKEMVVHTKEYMEQTIVTLLAGRGAEEILSNTQTTGVSQDIKEATEISRSMIMDYGMVDSLQRLDVESMDKKEVQQKVDEILNRAYIQAKDIISENLPRINLLSKVLQHKETLQEFEIDQIVNISNEDIKQDFDKYFELFTNNTMLDLVV